MQKTNIATTPGTGTDGLGIGPRDVQAGTAGTGPTAKDAERRRWIAEAFVGVNAARIAGEIEAGRMGAEILKQWRRYRTCAEKHWPFNERRKRNK
jgi:hypothetical protein